MQLLALLLACGGGGDAYIVEGLVLEVTPTQVTVEHSEIERLTGEGTSTFEIRDPSLVEELDAGDTIYGRMEIDESAAHLVKVRETGTRPLPDEYRPDRHRVVGKVVHVRDDSIVLDHQAIPGVMGAMVMPFDVRDPKILEGLSEGDEVQGHILTRDGYLVIDLQKVGEGEIAFRTDVVPLRVGQFLPLTEIPVEDGSSIQVGKGQGIPTALTFIYTRCPDPEFCPAVVSRMIALQEQIEPEKARIVTVTLDPDFDNGEVLTEYGENYGARPDTWRFGILDDEALQVLALQSGLTVTKEEGGKIGHFLRLLIFDDQGRLLERYDDNAWPMDRVVSQLKTGKPLGKPGAAGTIYETPDEDG